MFSIAHVIGSLQARVQVIKVGGLMFVKLRYWGRNKLCVSWCITQK